MEVAAATRSSSKRTSDKTSHKVVATATLSKADEADCVIARAEMLAERVLFLKRSPQPRGRYGLRTERSAVVSPLLRPSPPPGLELPQDFEATPPEAAEIKFQSASPQEEQLISGMPAPTPQEYKVLLQNLPPAMLKECMLRVMLEQANLHDAIHLDIRPTGKALLTFTTLASVSRCIRHFRGRQWGGSTEPVSATYVRTVKSSKEPTANAGSMQPTSLSAAAPVFVPSADKIIARDRCFSYASTDAGPMSDKVSDVCDSEPEPVACT